MTNLHSAAARSREPPLTILDHEQVARRHNSITTGHAAVLRGNGGAMAGHTNALIAAIVAALPLNACASPPTASPGNTQAQQPFSGNICIEAAADAALRAHADGEGVASGLELPLELYLKRRANLAPGAPGNRVFKYAGSCRRDAGDAFVRVSMAPNSSFDAVVTELEVTWDGNTQGRTFATEEPARDVRLKYFLLSLCADDPCGVPPGRRTFDAALDRTTDEIIQILKL